MKKRKVIIQSVIITLSIVKQNNNQLLRNCYLHQKKNHSASKTPLSSSHGNGMIYLFLRIVLRLFEYEQPEQKGHQRPVQYPQNDAAYDVRQVMHPQVHARERDRARQQQRRQPDPERTAPRRDRKGAEGGRAVTGGEGMVLRLIDFHIFIRDPCGRAVSAHALLDDDLAEQVIDAQCGGHDRAGFADAAGDQHRDHKSDPPDERAGTCVGEQHHDLVQHGAMDHGHALDDALVQLSQFLKHDSLRYRSIRNRWL